MAGGKETPRQKMIGLMYLVLTAMLALNVSKSILNGYLSVNESLEKTKKNITENNKRVTEAFKGSIAMNKAAEPYYNQALIAAKDLNELFKYIDDIKGNMAAYIVGFPPEVKVLGDTFNLRCEPWFANIGDYDKPATVLLGVDDMHHLETPLSAGDLKNRLIALHKKLFAQVDKMQKDPKQKMLDDDYLNLKKKIDILNPVASGFVEDGHAFTWEEDLADHLPFAAVVVNLNKIQADLKNVEAEILQVFSSASGKLAIKFDQIKARIIAPSSYIQSGQQYEATIFLGASSSTVKDGDMEIMLNIDSAAAVSGGKGSSNVPIVRGEGEYKVGTSGIGEQTYKGVVKYKSPDGSFKYYPFEGKYKVAPPNAAVSADQMKVFYAGVVNPVSATAAGKSPDDISITATGAGNNFVKTGPGKYDFTFTGIGECLITVSAKEKDGVKPQGPPFKFKVKPLPKPEAKVGGKFAPPEMKKGDLSSIAGIGAGANGFDFQANYITLSYEVTGKVKGKVLIASGNGANLAGDALTIFKGADVGSKIFIDIKVKGPDGKAYSSACGIKVTK